MKKKNGFTIMELIGVFVLLSLISLIIVPIVTDIFGNSKEKNRQNKLKTYAQEVYKSYMLTIAENEFYSFNSEENGGVTTNGVINFTNSWISDNIEVSEVNCNTENTYSNVFFHVNEGKVSLTECVIEDNYKYSYIDEKIEKK